jgi:dihydroorotase
MSEPLLFRQATLPSGEQTDVLVRDGLIVEMGSVTSKDARSVDAAGLQMLPGLVDLHTHLREPGFEQSETVLTGSQAAAVGGFTTVFPMANTMPVADNASVVELELARGREAGYVQVQPIGAVTAGLAGTALADLKGMADSRARVRVFSDDGKCVHDPLVMRRALEYVSAFDGVIAQHAQEPRLTEGAQMNEGEVASRLGLAGWPAIAEETIIARDVLIAESVGAALHVCHLSTAGSVDVIRWAKSRGIRVTAEVTPHHLLLTEDLAESYDARFKVNPPLRSSEDVMAVRQGLADGTIDIVATDHAPHPAEAKECEWDVAAFGMVGLESALSIVLLTMVESGELSWSDVERVMSRAPSQIGRVEWSGLVVGAPARLTLVDPADRHVFSTEHLASRSQNSPYLGRELPGRVVYTAFDGYLTVDAGTLVPAETVAAHAAATRANSAASGGVTNG